MVSGIIDRWGRIDVLVNCAGIIQVSPQRCLTVDDYRDAMDTHLWGPLNTIDAVLPHMRRRRDGNIVNIASIGGEIPLPHLLPYCASKYALAGLSETLATELASDGIRVTTVCPGLMRTGSPRNAFFKGQHRKEYAWFSIGASLPFITMSSQRAARKIIEASRYGRPYIALSPPAKIAARVHAMFPNTFIRMMRIVNGMLPGPNGGLRVNKVGKESESFLSPSPLTWLNERAAVKNNEVR
jgi:NAD(P)-dependent dehydrogenase (short-subunit alcohol dehydrogenase family)